MKRKYQYRLTYIMLGALLPMLLASIFYFGWQKEKANGLVYKESAYRATAVLDLVTNAPVLRFDSVRVSYDADKKTFRFNGVALSGGEVILGKRYTIPVGDSVNILEIDKTRVDLVGEVLEYDGGRYRVSYFTNAPREEWFYYNELVPLHKNNSYVPRGIQAMP